MDDNDMHSQAGYPMPGTGLTLSRFILSERFRGGWRQILEMPGARLVDWVCPVCNDSINYRESGRGICPRCGLPVKEYMLVSDQSPPDRNTLSKWAQFARDIFDEDG